MWPPVVVKVDVLRNTLSRLLRGVVLVKVNLFVLNGSPQSLGKDVVICSASSVKREKPALRLSELDVQEE